MERAARGVVEPVIGRLLDELLLDVLEGRRR
jgi:hypothetical protein